MAQISITANNFRLDDAEDIGGVSSRGGGAGAAAEAPLAYQGTNLWNRKISSSTGAGFEYDPVADGKSALDITNTTQNTWMSKFIVSDAGGLRGNDGVRLIVGDGTNEYAFITAGSDAIKSAYSQYKLRQATIICPVNPNISGYRDITHSDTNGSVTLTAVDQIGIDAEFALGTAKSENVGLDALDFGTGLTMSGGTSPDPEGEWFDFVDADEGTVGNRWGYANSTENAVAVFFGNLIVAAGFNDQGANILWPDHLADQGFSKVTFDLAGDGNISDGSTHTSLGTTNVVDTRLEVEWIGSTHSGTANHTMSNLRSYTLNASTTFSGNIQTSIFTQGGGTLTGGTIRANSLTTAAVCSDQDFTKISGVTFIQSGSGPMFEITTPGTYTLTSLFFQGFGINGASDAAIYNNSGGLVTINVSGGDSPTYINGTSATTVVNNTKTIDFTINFEGTAPANYEWRLYEKSGTSGTIGTVELDGAESETLLSLSYSYNYVADTDAILQIIATGFEEENFDCTLLNSNQSLNVNVSREENI